jgi:hypothetical protein
MRLNDSRSAFFAFVVTADEVNELAMGYMVSQ